MGEEWKAKIPTEETEMDRVSAGVLEKIKPGAKEKKWEKKLEKEIIGKLSGMVPPGVEVALMGSVAKNTNLKGSMDFDVFLLFPKSFSRKDLADIGLSVGKKSAKGHRWEVGYAEHPYVRVYLKKVKMDVVPAYKISSADEVETAVDRSQLHARYIKERFSEKTCDQVRLLKQFLKAHEVYGAELKVEGLSGYLCELLVLHYGSFANVVKAASEWRTPVAIDIEKNYGEKELSQTFEGAPMIVIDPVDRDRNVAAVVSETNLAKFIFAARRFAEKPTEEAFYPKKETRFMRGQLEKNIAGRGTDFVLIEFECPQVVPDILWPQLRKTLKQIERHFELADFRVIGSDCWSDEKKQCLLLLELESAVLPQAKKIKGPAIWHAGDLKQFLVKHAAALTGPWIEKVGTAAVERRKFTQATALLEEIAKYPKLYGIPTHVSKKLKDCRAFIGRKALRKETAAFIGRYLNKRM